MTELEAIAAYLQSNSVAVLATNMYIADLPSSPDTCLVVRGYGGLVADLNVSYDPFFFQIFVRGKTYPLARTLIDSAYNYLQALGSKDLSNIHFVDIRAIQAKPMYLGKDSTNRMLFSQNYWAEIYNKTVHRV